MTLILQVFYSVFSGVMLSAAIPNEIYMFGNPVLAFIALIPFYICIRYYCKSFRCAFWMSFLQVLTTHLLSSFWLAFFKDFAIFTLGASALATACIGGFMGMFMFLPFSRKTYGKITDSLIDYRIEKPFYEHTSFRVLYFAFIYTLYEWVKSSGFIGYPWGTVSSAMFNFNVFMQLAAITGTYGITFLTVMFNCLVAEGAILFLESKKLFKAGILESEDKKQFFFEYINLSRVFLLFFGITLLYGYYQSNLKRTPSKTLTTIMVQQNSDPWKQSSDKDSILKSERLTYERIEDLKRDNKKPQLVVWSEGCLLKTFPGAMNYYRSNPSEIPLVDFIADTKSPLLAGGSYVKIFEDKKIVKEVDEETGEEIEKEVVEEQKCYFNAAHVFDEKGNYRGYYGKLHLVPFAEAVPGAHLPFIKKIMVKILGFSAFWSHGEQLRYFDIPCSYYDKEYIPAVESTDVSVPYSTERNKPKPTVRICTPICFDDAFTDVMRPLYLNGAELFVNITDDSWSLKKSSEIQHFVIASYRAIEYRTTMIRSANAGYSVVISPAGKLLVDQPLFTDSSACYEVPVYYRTMTTYARFGNWLPYLSIIILFFVSALMKSSFVLYDFIPSERKKNLSKKLFKLSKKSKDPKKSKDSGKGKKKQSKKNSKKK